MRFFRFIFFICFFATAQERSLLFKVVADSLSVEGIHVANLVNEKSTITDASGMFTLAVSEGDLIVLSSVSFEYQRKLIEIEDFDRPPVVIKMYPKVHKLNEVVVNANTHINALSLGIISKPVKQYTPAERRLLQAGDFRWWQLIGLIGGQLPIDPILNAISGRTDMLKKEVVAERKTMLREKLLTRYGEDYFIKHLSIKAEQVNGFLFFASESAKMSTAFASDNNTKITFVLAELANEYNAILKQIDASK